MLARAVRVAHVLLLGFAIMTTSAGSVSIFWTRHARPEPEPGAAGYGRRGG